MTSSSSRDMENNGEIENNDDVATAAAGYGIESQSKQAAP